MSNLRFFFQQLNDISKAPEIFQLYEPLFFKYLLPHGYEILVEALDITVIFRNEKQG